VGNITHQYQTKTEPPDESSYRPKVRVPGWVTYMGEMQSIQSSTHPVLSGHRVDDLLRPGLVTSRTTTPQENPDESIYRPEQQKEDIE